MSDEVCTMQSYVKYFATRDIKELWEETEIRGKTK